MIESLTMLERSNGKALADTNNPVLAIITIIDNIQSIKSGSSIFVV